MVRKLDCSLINEPFSEVFVIAQDNSLDFSCVDNGEYIVLCFNKTDIQIVCELKLGFKIIVYFQINSCDTMPSKTDPRYANESLAFRCFRNH